MPPADKCILFLGSLVLLTACARGPSSIDVEAATKSAIRDVPTSRGVDISVSSVKNQGCAPDGSGAAYVCTVELELNLPMGNRMTGSTVIRMVKSGDSWVHDKTKGLSIQGAASS